MIRRRLTFALLPFALTAQLGTADAQPTRPATAQPAPVAPRLPRCCRKTPSRHARRGTS